jgi:hypothetical protein
VLNFIEKIDKNIKSRGRNNQTSRILKILKAEKKNDKAAFNKGSSDWRLRCG